VAGESDDGRPQAAPAVGQKRLGARFLALLERPGGFYPLTAVLTFLIWAIYYRRVPGSDAFRIPIAYGEGGDVLLVLGIAQGFSGLPAPWDIEVSRLNAPFGADWNDYPHTEKLLFYPWGVLLRWFEPGTVANWFVVLAHVTAALAFAWCARKLGRTAWSALAGALMFAFCQFMVMRSLGHLNVSFVWHLPLLIYLTIELGRMEHLPSRNVQVLAGLLLLATSLQNPYYPPLAFQLVALGSLQALLRGRKPVARFGGVLLAVGIGSFLLGQVNVFIRSWSVGPNPLFSGRSLEAIRMWALRLPDLFMPVGHPIEAWADFARTHYFTAGNPISENASAFLGLVGCALLVGLVLVAFKRGLGGRLHDVPVEAWLVAYVLLFSLSGGLAYLVGSLGMTWLRAVNRYSIVVLALTLLWGAGVVDRLPKPWMRWGGAAAGLFVSLLELFSGGPGDRDAYTQHTGKIVDSDREFAQALERKLPRGAAVFELPVVDFPESPPILEMPDCAHFRPYLYSEALRFSYGTHKGRPREIWQRHAEQLSPRRFVAYLADHGFDAVLLNRTGLPGSGQALEQSLARQGLARVVESPRKDMVVYRLPRKGSKLPAGYASVGLFEGFPWGWEEGGDNDWSWSSGDARLRMIVAPGRAQRYRVSFELETLVPRNLEAWIDSERVVAVPLVPGSVIPVSFEWTPRGTVTLIDLKTNVPAVDAGHGDPRRVGFRVVNPTAEPLGRERRR